MRTDRQKSKSRGVLEVAMTKVYRIETLEKWEAVAVYIVSESEASSLEEAIELVKKGEVAYEKHEHDGDDDEFLAVLSAEEMEY